MAFADSATARSIPHVVPPPGTPDLSQTVLQPSDFSHAAVGDGSFVVPATIAINGVTLSVNVIQVRVDRAFGEIFLGAAGKIRPRDARTLARAIAQHTRSVLATG